jgi:hypothetical protein
MQPPDLMLDKTVKEMVNLIYGKLAQSVAGMRIIKDDVERRRVFNTMFERERQLGAQRHHSADDGRVLHRTGSRSADRDQHATTDGDLGRDVHHRRIVVELWLERYRPERTDGDGVPGGTRAYHAGR